jgi:peptide deformylase
MPRLPLVIYPDSILRKLSVEISEIDQSLVDFGKAMAETMVLSHGIGLAAPQVARNIRLITVDVEQAENASTLFHLINPVIVEGHGRIVYEEGCLSFPGLTAEVRRKEQIHLQAYDLDGNEVDIEASGLLSICIQHEIDHLNGVCFVDRINSVRRKLVMRQYLADRKSQQEDDSMDAIRSVHEE